MQSKFNSIIKKLFLIAGILVYMNSSSQNTTSPYSILGIGDVENKEHSRYFITGNAAIARRNDQAYNFSNPASLTAFPNHFVYLDFAGRGKTSNYVLPGNSNTTNPDASKDFVVKRATLVVNTGSNLSFAFGLKPYSSINYLLTDRLYIGGNNDQVVKLIDGSGGINQVYGSLARKFGKNVSAGITASWLFGSIQRNITYYDDENYINIEKNDYTFFTAPHLTAGMQFYTASKKSWQHSLGITGTLGQSLKGYKETSYTENSVVIEKNIETGKLFSLPLSFGAGYTANHNNKVALSIEGNYYNWKQQKLNYTNSYTQPAFKLSSGIEYSFKYNTWNKMLEKAFVGTGINVEKTYLAINNKSLWDRSVTVGGGFNAIRNHISFYGGIEAGIKGDLNADQIKEKYTQFIIGITLKDIWLSTRKTGRYN